MGRKSVFFTKINVSSGIKIDDNLSSFSFSGTLWCHRHHNATAALHSLRTNLTNWQWCHVAKWTCVIYLFTCSASSWRTHPDETRFHKSVSKALKGFLYPRYFNSQEVVIISWSVEVVIASNLYCVVLTADLKALLRFPKVQREDPWLASKGPNPWLSGLKVNVSLKKKKKKAAWGHGNRHVWSGRRTDGWTVKQNKATL